MEEGTGGGLLEGAFERAPIGIVVQNLDGEVILANRVALEALRSTTMLSTTAGGRYRVDIDADPDACIVDRSGNTVGLDELPAQRAIRTGRPAPRVVQGLRRGDATIWAAITASPIERDGRVVGVVTYSSDVTADVLNEDLNAELVKAAADARHRLVQAATTDPLTGLLNRSSIETWLQRQLVADLADPVALLLIDLDHFKRINDTVGHDAGDEVLMQVADRIGIAVRDGDVVARPGGDEFFVAMRAATASTAGVLAERLLHILDSPFDVRGRRYSLTASIGVAAADQHSTVRSLLSDADSAMYEAKAHGRNRWALFDDRLRKRADHRFEVDAGLRYALERDEIVAHYQPLFSTQTGRPTAVEALARWQHPVQGLLAAGDFVPIAEESDMIVAMGTRMIELAIRDLDRIALDVGCATARAWVNVSARQLDRRAHMEMLRLMLTAGNVIGRIGVEVTETSLVRDESGAAETLRQLAEAGVPVALDDFGTGFSSMARLLDFPIHMLKIDQAFTQALHDRRTVAAVRTIVELAAALGANVCLEGVENNHQLRVAIDLGVERVSGYHLARPVPLADLRREVGRCAPRLNAFTASAPNCLTGTAGV